MRYLIEVRWVSASEPMSARYGVADGMCDTEEAAIEIAKAAVEASRIGKGETPVDVTASVVTNDDRL